MASTSLGDELFNVASCVHAVNASSFGKASKALSRNLAGPIVRGEDEEPAWSQEARRLGEEARRVDPVLDHRHRGYRCEPPVWERCLLYWSYTHSLTVSGIHSYSARGGTRFSSCDRRPHGGKRTAQVAAIKLPIAELVEPRKRNPASAAEISDRVVRPMSHRPDRFNCVDVVPALSFVGDLAQAE
jgi:hypothetical protein